MPTMIHSVSCIHAASVRLSLRLYDRASHPTSMTLKQNCRSEKIQVNVITVTGRLLFIVSTVLKVYLINYKRGIIKSLTDTQKRDTRRKVIVLSLILALLSGTHCHHIIIRNAATVTTFKSALKTHFFSLYHSD